MHPKMKKRRGAMPPKQLARGDRDIGAVRRRLAHRIRPAGSICLGDREARPVETRVHASVDSVVRLPTASEDGRGARRAPIGERIEREDTLAAPFRAVWTGGT